MKKLINGIIEFRRDCLSDYIEKYSRLAAGQSPDTLLIVCSDSRVAPNVFASTNPGDVFVIRNVGNLIPAFDRLVPHGGASEPAALEFALHNLTIKDIVVCGHSDCGAMHAVMAGIHRMDEEHLRDWLHHCGFSPHELERCAALDKSLPLHNRLAQLNVLQQLDHLRTYPMVQERLSAATLNLHGWYFDIAHGDVYNYEPDPDRFVLIDEAEAKRILTRLK